MDMRRLLLSLFLLLTPVLYAGEAAIPPCGIASAYGTLVHFGIDVSLNGVTQRYQDLFSDEDPRMMPLSRLQTLIQSFGLHTLAVQGDLSALDSSYLPAILCIVNDPDGRPLPVGHVVLLRDIQDGTATCSDYQTGIETRSIPLAQLQILSEGKVMLVSKNHLLLPFPWIHAALWFTMFTSVLGFVCVMHSWKQSRKAMCLKYVANALALLILTLLVSGCYKAEVDTKNSTGALNVSGMSDTLLFFDACVQNFGEFQLGREVSSGSKVEFVFPFKVGKEEVIIEKIDPSCGCVVSDSLIIGHPLPAGSEQNLKLAIDLQGRCGEFTALAHVVTKPKTKEPIVLNMTVFVKCLPEVVSSELRCRSISGRKIENVDLNIYYRHDKSVDKIGLDSEKSDFGQFNLVHSEVISEAAILQPKEIKDNIRLNLESKNHYVPGQYEDQWTIHFKGGFEPIIVPVKIQIVPPIALAVERLFVGEMAPGEEKTIPIRITLNESDRIPNVRIISADENIQVEFDEPTMRLHVTIKAPQEGGRFEKNMRLTFGSDDLAFDFPISGIVQRK